MGRTFVSDPFAIDSSSRANRAAETARPHPQAAVVAGFVYLRRTGFTTRPCLIALALTFTRTIWPSMTARTFWMFGLNVRAVMPVTLVPTPPRYFALPRWVI